MHATLPTLRLALAFSLGLAGTVFAADSAEIAALRAKAEKGNSIAQYNLGLAYADAQQPTADRIEAYVWLNLAAENGSTGKALNTLVDQMTPNQLAEGARRLQERRAQLTGAREPLAAAAADPLAKLTAERDQLVASLNAATTELAALRASQAQPSIAPAGTDKLRADLAFALSDLDEARAAARTLAAKNQQLEDVASERGRALAAAQSELANAKRPAAPDRTAELAQLTQARAAAETRAKDFEARLAATQSELANLRTKQAAAGDAASQIATLNRQLADAQAQTGQIADLAAQLARAKHELDELNKKNALLGDYVQRATATTKELEPLRSRIATLEQQNSELTARALKAEEKFAAADAKLATIAASSGDADDLKKQLATSEDKLATTLHSYSLLQQELEKTKTDLTAAAQKDQATLRQAATSAATEAVGLRDQLRQAQSTTAQLAEENAQLKTRLVLLGPPPAPVLASPTRAGEALPPTKPTAPTQVQASKSAPAAASAAPAPAAAEPRQHTIADGDTLSKISRKYYGTAERWPEIFAANRDVLKDAGRLPLGATLKIP
jgi:nucleoid-associated protein YgaU